MVYVLCGGEDRVAKVTGVAFLHVSIGVVQFALLVSERRKTSIMTFVSGG